ncbi:hypothetical protein [Bacillus sp. FJAT-27225]|uniref:hypothetical protein n=1 Tax=Bacillus sp. FJAT-27225 TaxID=1743144 RepID=UPI00269B9090
MDRTPYGFELLVYKLQPAPNPFFPNDWEERLNRFDDLTIIRTQQCPFIDVATENMVAGADRLGINDAIINIKTRDELLALSPTPYGIYGVVYKKRLIAYHRLTVHSAMKRLKAVK